eukprot:scaffold21816_cov133-Skeletonema_dohrnii-CCMP3373.AAC.2
MSLLYHRHQSPKSIQPHQILFELHEEEEVVGIKLEIDYNYGYGSEDAGLKPYAYEYISSILNMKSLGEVLCTLRRVTQEERTLQACHGSQERQRLSRFLQIGSRSSHRGGQNRATDRHEVKIRLRRNNTITVTDPSQTKPARASDVEPRSQIEGGKISNVTALNGTIDDALSSGMLCVESTFTQGDVDVVNEHILIVAHSRHITGNIVFIHLKTLIIAYYLQTAAACGCAKSNRSVRNFI